MAFIVQHIGPTSVFDMISKDDKDKMKQAQNRLSENQSSSTTAPFSGRQSHQAPPSMSMNTPTANDPNVKWGMGGGFQPFAKEPEKQMRYEAFLEKSKGLGKGMD